MMDTTGSSCQVENTDIFLPLSSLRLLIPPLRLLSAAMWQVAQRREVLDYEKLDEFVTPVTATVPDLLGPKQRGKLLLRLRAKIILELCRNEETANILCVQPHLERIRPPGYTGSGDAEVDAEEAIFVELIHTPLKEPAERQHFYQEVFPTEYGLSYDTDMQLLVWELLSKLEKLLPVPDLSKIFILRGMLAGFFGWVWPVQRSWQVVGVSDDKSFPCLGRLAVSRLNLPPSTPAWREKKPGKLHTLER